MEELLNIGLDQTTLRDQIHQEVTWMMLVSRQVWTWSLEEVDIADIIVKVMEEYQVRRTGKGDGPECAVLVVLTIQ
jgi:hypothetical protein